MQTRKDDHESDFRDVAEHLSRQPETFDRGFWKEYFYWAWRCLLFVLFIVIVTNLNFGEGIVGSFEHISPAKWAVLIIAPLLFGPAVFIGWSYLWKWGQDLVERTRR